jgi:hypothetical protein
VQKTRIGIGREEWEKDKRWTGKGIRERKEKGLKRRM